MKKISHKQAWERLRLLLRCRAEYFFYAQGDDPNSVYRYPLMAIDTTLDQMAIIDKDILKLEVVPNDKH